MRLSLNIDNYMFFFILIDFSFSFEWLVCSFDGYLEVLRYLRGFILSIQAFSTIEKNIGTLTPLELVSKLFYGNRSHDIII
jgi:hypothetical protein